MSGEKVRIKEIDILRGIAICLMILGHSIIVYPVNLEDVSWCRLLKDYIYTFHMELFFLLAGFVYHRTEFKRYIGNKTKRILIPYMFFGLITIVFKAFGGNLVNGNSSVKDGTISFLFNGGNYWFLYTLFIIYLIFPAVEKVIDTKFKMMAVIVILLVFSEFFSLPDILQLNSIIHYMPFFLLGRLVAELARGGGDSITKYQEQSSTWRNWDWNSWDICRAVYADAPNGSTIQNDLFQQGSCNDRILVCNCSSRQDSYSRGKYNTKANHHKIRGFFYSLQHIFASAISV